MIWIAASIVCLLLSFDLLIYAQSEPTADSSFQSPVVCKDAASPGVIQLTPDPTHPNKLALARKVFYLSTAPFDLVNNLDLKTAPALRGFYNSVGASPELIDWLEENNCSTVYCRELTPNEINCEGGAQKRCVPEFAAAYRNALMKLNGNQELARKLITNFEPLSAAKLRLGFFEARALWLQKAVSALEKKLGNNLSIRSSLTDKDGSAFFYDLCPGTYYISSIAPFDIKGTDIFWESSRPIRVDGPPEVNKAVVVTLAFPPGKDKKNFFVGRRVSEIGQ